MVDWHPPETVAVWLLNSRIPMGAGEGSIGGGVIKGGRGGAGGDGGAGGASKCTSSAGCCATVAQAAVRMPHPLPKYGTKTQP